MKVESIDAWMLAQVTASIVEYPAASNLIFLVSYLYLLNVYCQKKNDVVND